MTEKEVQLLGLQLENIPDGDNEDSNYYVIDIVDGLTLITPTRDEIINNNWYVEIFNTDPTIRFYNFDEVQPLINKLKNAIVKK
jgi:hypothetical protein